MVIKTILIFLIALLGYSEWLTGTSYLQRPIVLGPLVGLVMGDMVTGTIMGATMELAMVGAISVGAYNRPIRFPEPSWVCRLPCRPARTLRRP